MRRSAGRVGRILLLATALAMVIAALLLIWPHLESSAAYDRARDLATAAGAPDLSAVSSLNPDTVAWLEVEGTPIDHPVVQPSGGTPRDWYLGHAYDGAPSVMGTPYLDARAQADGALLVAYAHNDPLGGLFHAVACADDARGLEEIGTARWTTERGTTEFHPLFTIKVDRAYAKIQRFEVTGDGVPALLEELSGDAVATCEGWEEEALGAGRILALSTCSNGVDGGATRTICVFAAEAEPAANDEGKDG